jgi:hypothetical protein
MTTTPAPPLSAHRTAVPQLGTVTVVAAVLGALSAVLLLGVPAQVAEDRYSYPITAGAYVGAQLFFAVQHLGLLAGIVGLAACMWRGGSRLVRLGLTTAAFGMLLLSACEVVAIAAAGSAIGSARADAVDRLYGLPIVLIGVGLVAAGVPLADRSLAFGQRWSTLVLGVYVFVVLTPAMFAGFVAGRVAIGVWMLLFIPFGQLVRAVAKEQVA